jgi:hypothetical protein
VAEVAVFLMLDLPVLERVLALALNVGRTVLILLFAVRAPFALLFVAVGAVSGFHFVTVFLNVALYVFTVLGGFGLARAAVVFHHLARFRGVGLGDFRDFVPEGLVFVAHLVMIGGLLVLHAVAERAVLVLLAVPEVAVLLLLLVAEGAVFILGLLVEVAVFLALAFPEFLVLVPLLFVMALRGGGRGVFGAGQLRHGKSGDRNGGQGHKAFHGNSSGKNMTRSSYPL